MPLRCMYVSKCREASHTLPRHRQTPNWTLILELIKWSFCQTLYDLFSHISYSIRKFIDAWYKYKQAFFFELCMTKRGKKSSRDVAEADQEGDGVVAWLSSLRIAIASNICPTVKERKLATIIRSYSLVQIGQHCPGGLMVGTRQLTGGHCTGSHFGMPRTHQHFEQVCNYWTTHWNWSSQTTMLSSTYNYAVG